VTWRSCIVSSIAAVDLVGQQEVREGRTGPELELLRLLVVHVDARDVAGQQVRRELDAAEVRARRLREHVGHQRLGRAGVVLEEDVPAGQDVVQDLLQQRSVADDDLADLVDHLLALRRDEVDGVLQLARVVDPTVRASGLATLRCHEGVLRSRAWARQPWNP
jgi:hypothetical protein